jgi:hypothetical protein
MSLFDWFFSKPRERQGTDLVEPLGSPAMAVRPRPAQPAQRPAAPLAQAMDGRRAMRHARREQLYVAVREAMTRSGVLSATYKFKVLSLDQPGNEFLVMVDLSLDFDGITGQLGAMEALIVQHARARFGITVPTVYWRMDANIPSSAVRQAPAKPAARTPEVSPATPAEAAAATPVPVQRPASHEAIRRDPIEAEEVAAFKQALLAASAHAPVAVAGTGSRKPARTVHSYALLTGFEDTEQTESAASPGLSKTQYGDLS